MKDFRTVLPILSQDFKIAHPSGVCLMGSCFAEHIGQKLQEAKFSLLQNPFGILYNPFSIAQSLERITSKKPFVADDLVERKGLWLSFMHHSRYADLDATLALKKMNDSLQQAHQFLKTAKVLFISLGSAKVYQLKATKEVVANCHKFPAASFDALFLKEKEIATALAQAIDKLKVFNSDLSIIFTVSPVRHLKDGFVENQRSKAALLQAIGTLQQQYTQVGYFPSYEIMMDDLRDYRFYASDRVHPNKDAIDYIFGYFDRTYFDDETRSIMQQVCKIKAAVEHRPFNSLGVEYQAHLTSTLSKVKALRNTYPFIDFEQEVVQLSKRMTKI